MFKKVIAIMTATVLAASMLVACGGSTGASSSAPAEETVEEEAEAPAEQKPVELKDEPKLQEVYNAYIKQINR